MIPNCSQQICSQQTSLPGACPASCSVTLLKEASRF